MHWPVRLCAHSLGGASRSALRKRNAARDFKNRYLRNKDLTIAPASVRKERTAVLDPIERIPTPDEMTNRIARWRLENKTLRAYADRCEDKTAERIVVELPAAHHPREFHVDRDRIFAYVKKRRQIVPLSFVDRFFSLPFLPTMFDRAHARQLRNSVDYYADLRELTPLMLVRRPEPVGVDVAKMAS